LIGTAGLGAAVALDGFLIAPYILLPRLARKYPIGLDRDANMQVYTNRGIGMVTPHVRPNCPLKSP